MLIDDVLWTQLNKKGCSQPEQKGIVNWPDNWFRDHEVEQGADGKKFEKRIDA